MFTTHSTEAGGFASSWKTKSDTTSSGAQTEEMQFADEGNQVLETNDFSSQTEEEEVKPLSSEASYNEMSLLDFLRKITPKVEEELEKQSRSRAFDSYAQLEDESFTGVKQLHILKWSQLFSDAVVTGLDWSCTGSVIAVGFGAKSHSDWCDHKGAIAIWNINRSDFSANQPHHEIETSSCVSSLAFHPTNPAIFAVGTLSGEIQVYDVFSDEPTTPLITKYIEGGSVTAVTWIPTTSSPRRYNLISTSSSGAILIWAFTIDPKLTIANGFILLAEEISRTVRTDKIVGAPVNTVSFNVEDPSIFVVGAEGGSVMLCSTLSQIHSGEKYESINLNKCVTSQFASHNGRIIVTMWSLHHRNALMTLTSDNQLRLYSLLQPNKPVNVIYSENSLTTASWSPSKPGIVAVGTDSGEVTFYSLANKTNEAILHLAGHEKTAAISKVSFNKKNITLIGVGDTLGRVTIWQLPHSVVSQQPSDKSSLVAVVDTLDE